MASQGFATFINDYPWVLGIVFILGGPLVALYGSDKNAKDVSRVLRLPGFFHQKGESYLSEIVHESGRGPYTAAEILEAFPPVTKKSERTIEDYFSPAPAATEEYVPISEADAILHKIKLEALHGGHG